MSIPAYILAVQHIPNTIFESIAKLARNFLWHKDSNCSGLPLIAWDIITTNKTYRGLAIRNLKNVRTAFMAKNVVRFLNSDSAF